jgi:hypothetical protein
VVGFHDAIIDLMSNVKADKRSNLIGKVGELDKITQLLDTASGIGALHLVDQAGDFLRTIEGGARRRCSNWRNSSAPRARWSAVASTTSVLLPIAMPTGAAASAGASLMYVRLL